MTQMQNQGLRSEALRKMGSPQHGVPDGVSVGQDGSDKMCVGQVGSVKMSSVWAKMARTRCPVCGPKWLGQDVQFVGQDDSCQEFLLWCQEGTRLGVLRSFRCGRGNRAALCRYARQRDRDFVCRVILQWWWTQ